MDCAIVSSNLFAFPSSISLAGNKSSRPIVNTVEYRFENGTLYISGQGVVTKDWVKILPQYEIFKLCFDSEQIQKKYVNPSKEKYGEKFINDLLPDLCDFYTRCCVVRVIVQGNITEFGEEAFHGCANLREFVMPNNTIKKIGKGAFSFCISLPRIKFSNTVEEIEDKAFNYCESLSEFSAPGCVIKKMGDKVFYNCQSLVRIDVKFVKEAGRYVFNGCTSLVSRPQMFKYSTNEKWDGCINLLNR